MKKVGLFTILVFCALCCFSQSDSVQMVVYDTDFQFTEGIYLTFDQVKKNNPLLKARIIATEDYNKPDFFEILLSKDEFSYYDGLSMKQTVKVKQIWGFAKNGNLYVRMNETFNKVTYIGSICHFLATVYYTYQQVYDPYYYNPYYYYSGRGSSSVSKSELKQFIFDFNTGKIYDYEVKNVGALLIADPVLYDEYMALSRKKKQQLMFYYLRKYNERNPLKIPVYLRD